MNILAKTTLAGLRLNRTRTAVTIIGVLLSVSLVTAVTVFAASLKRFVVEDAINSSGNWHASFYDVDYPAYQALLADADAVKVGLQHHIGYIEIVNTGYSNYSDSYFRLVGLDDNAFDCLPAQVLTSGRLPQNSDEILLPESLKDFDGANHSVGESISLGIGSLDFVEKPGDNPDDTILVSTVNEQLSQTFTIVGFYVRPNQPVYGLSAYTVASGSALEARLVEAPVPMIAAVSPGLSADDLSADGLSADDPSVPDQSSTARVSPPAVLSLDDLGSFDIVVRLRKPAEVYDFAERYSQGFDMPHDFNHTLLRGLGVSENDNLVATINQSSALLIAVIVFGSVLTIHNSFAISVSERSRQFGILASVGATRRQLRRSVMTEGLVIGALGIPLGLLLGIVGIGLSLGVINVALTNIRIDNVNIHMSVSVAALVIAAAVGVAVILISAYLPAFSATRHSAIESIRQTTDIRVQPTLLKTSPLIAGLFGVTGTLAAKNYRHNRRRYRATVLSIFVSVVLFISAASFSLYFNQAVRRIRDVSGADITVTLYGIDLDVQSELFDEMKACSTVTDSTYAFKGDMITLVSTNYLSPRYLEQLHRDGYGFLAAPSGEQPGAAPGESLELSFDIIFVDDASYLRYIESLGLPVDKYDGSAGCLVATDLISGYDPPSKRYVNFVMFDRLSDLELTVYPNWAVNYTFITDETSGMEQTGIYPPDTSGNTGKQANEYGVLQGNTAIPTNINVHLVNEAPPLFSLGEARGLTVYAPYSMIDRFDIDLELLIGENSGHFEIRVAADDAIQAEADLRTLLNSRDELHDSYYIYNATLQLQQYRTIGFCINVFTYGFSVLLTLVAVSGVFNTISTSIRLRRRELAMLRSVGMDNRGVNRMMGYECLMFGSRALVFGILVSLAVNVLIYRIVQHSVDVDRSWPLFAIAACICGVFAIMLVTMVYAVRQANRENIIDVLRSDLY